ncbi:MAG: prepilin peptidase [Thermoguttaceae bacterium]|jgi:prepilin signal peptidase PulO-like enzyme (type II secretory pathway)
MFPETLSTGAAAEFFAVWLFALGAVIGSFLNVVAYRLPAGIGLSFPGSHCPACKHPIRWFDNIPVLGWIVLAGRCRDCRQPISLRYPLVEAVTGALFVGLAEREWFSWGANLPLDPHGTPGWSFLQLGAMFAFHAFLLATLLTAALITIDGHRPPLRLFLPALAVGLIAPAVWPGLHPLPAWPGLAAHRFAGLPDGLLGLVSGLLLGGLPQFRKLVTRHTSPTRQQGGIAANPSLARRASEQFSWQCSQCGLAPAAACIGLYLGWQAVFVLLPLGLLLHLVCRNAARFLPFLARLSPLTLLSLATLAWIMFWRPIVAWAMAW